MHPRSLAATSLAISILSIMAGDQPAVAQTSAAGDQAAIDELVLINRMLASREMGVLGAYGHVSVRNRRDPSHYFISRNVAPGIVTSDDIYESDLENRPVAAARQDLSDDRFIHGEIYKARPEVMAVVYTTAPELAAFSVSSIPIVWNSSPMKAFDPRKISGGQNGFVNTPALGRALAESLGRGNAVLVFGQGAVVVSATTNDLVNGAVRLEQEALQQQFATALGGTPNHVAFTKEATPETRTNLRTGNVERVDRFSIFFNYLGARDLAKINGKAAPAGESDQAAIEELVVANRLLASTDLGVLTPDGLAHVSVRSRTNPNHFFIAHDVAPGMVTAADIIEDDLDANPVKAGNVAQYSERFIHSETYRARPDVMAVLHAHTPELRVFGQSSVKLRPVWNRALFMGDGLPIFDIVKFDPDAISTLINSPELGRKLVALMGKKDGALLLDHGIALAGPSLRGLVSRAYNLRLDARIQRMAIALGGTVNYFEAQPDGPSRGVATYPEWDYWKQLVIGSTDLATVPKPASGLPLRPHQ